MITVSVSYHYCFKLMRIEPKVADASFNDIDTSVIWPETVDKNEPFRCLQQETRCAAISDKAHIVKESCSGILVWYLPYKVRLVRICVSPAFYVTFTHFNILLYEQLYTEQSGEYLIHSNQCKHKVYCNG